MTCDSTGETIRYGMLQRTGRMFRKHGWKYQYKEDYVTHIDIRVPGGAVHDRWIELTPEGRLTIRAGYAWDGPSGPTFDSPTFMRGSGVHDALYQLITEGLLPQSYQRAADAELYRICLEDCMMPIRAWLDNKGLWLFGWTHLIRRRRKSKRLKAAKQRQLAA